MCEARPARLSLTSTPATAATCTVAAATGEASRLAPAGSADFRGAMENEDNEFQEMDTTPAATTTTDPTRKCRRDPTGRDDAGNAARKTVAITAPTSRRTATGGAASVDDDDSVAAAAVTLADDAEGGEDSVVLCAGWTQVVSRRAKKNLKASGAPSQQGSSQPGKPSTLGSASNSNSNARAVGRQQPTRAQFAAKVNAEMARAARMPSFASRDEIRVVVRPRGGLVIAKTPMTALRGAIFAAAGVGEEEADEDSVSPNAAQNIIVISTPSEKRANKYGSTRAITVGEVMYETYAYWATPENTSRGVIRGVGHEESEEDIRRRVVNAHNPTAMAAHRLGGSTSVVILFEGQKVPHYVKYGGFITKCTLYRQHREVCKTCGQVGHRKDVCPTPNARVCFACGRRNPGADHAEYCRPRCRLCGGSHVTGAGSCKNKFKTPLQIKKRQWARQQAEERTTTKMAPAPLQPALKVRLSRRDEFRKLERNHRDGSRAESRDWRKLTPGEGGPTWADITTGGAVTAAMTATAAPRRQRSASRRRQQQGAGKKSSGGAAAAATRAEQWERERSAPRGRGVSSSGSTSRRAGNKSGGGGGSSSDEDHRAAMEEMREAMKEMRAAMQRQQAKINTMQLTINQQRNTITQLKAGKSPGPAVATTAAVQQQQKKPAMAVVTRDSTSGAPSPQPTTSRAFQFTATVSSSKKKETEREDRRKVEDQEEDDEEVFSASDDDGEDGDGGDAAARTSTSSAAMAKTAVDAAAAKQPLGYAGLNNRIRQLTNITNYWGKNLENLEHRLLNKITQVMQQQQQQLQQQMQQQFQQFQQQIQQQISPERLQALVDTAVQRYCNASESPLPSP